MADCIFCKIIVGEVPSDIKYRDDKVIALSDIHPLTPTHLLIMPKKHIPSLADMSDDDASLVGDMARVANKLAKETGISEKGYRLVINCGRHGTQGVAHLHMHLLGGRQLSAELG